jgi:hypothetical protein
MAKDKKTDGPACSCSRGDLYEDWKKLNEDKKEESSESTDSKHTDGDKSSDEAVVKDAQMKEETKK